MYEIGRALLIVILEKKTHWLNKYSGRFEVKGCGGLKNKQVQRHALIQLIQTDDIDSFLSTLF